MSNWGLLSVLPPLCAILLAITTRQVYLSLAMGIYAGWIILSYGNPFTGLAAMLEAFIRVFQDADNTRIILFSAMVGSLIALMQRSGGVQGFVNYISSKKLFRSRRSAEILAWILGVIIFIESSIKILIVGTICRPLFDRMRISREKLAFIADSTSAPICMLIPLNAWGAFVIGLLRSQGEDAATAILINSIPFNFYSILMVLFVLFVAWTGWDFGPMRRAEKRVLQENKILRDGAAPLVDEQILTLQPINSHQHHARNMLIPVIAMSLAMPLFLWITGHGNLTHGSGSTAVFWSVTLAIFLAAGMYRLQGLMRTKELMDLILKGAGGMISLALLMLLAFALGATCKQLGTGAYIAQVVSGTLPASLVGALIFAVSASVAFATGTSFGTFALMIPLAVPLAHSVGAHLPLVVSAVLAGGVFGDHCSPISDTTIVASMASACDHIDHVNTQLPYAVLVASGALLLYIFAGLIIG